MTNKRTQIGAVALSLLLSGAAMAKPPEKLEPWALNAFTDAPVGSMDVLQDVEMERTEGKLLPFIVGVVTIDFALASYFWGTYVPTVTGGGGCGSCYYTPPNHR